MGKRLRGAFVAIVLAGAVSLPIAAQQRTQGRGAASASRPDRIAGHPNLNGIWQAINSANWNLEGHAAAATPVWQLGAMFAVPPGQSVIVDNNGTIPYTPAGLKMRERAVDWLKRELAAGPRKSADVYAAAAQAGIPERTLERAKQQLPAKSHRTWDEEEQRGEWYWYDRDAAWPEGAPFEKPYQLPPLPPLGPLGGF